MIVLPSCTPRLEPRCRAVPPGGRSSAPCVDTVSFWFLPGWTSCIASSFWRQAPPPARPQGGVPAGSREALPEFLDVRYLEWDMHEPVVEEGDERKAPDRVDHGATAGVCDQQVEQTDRISALISQQNTVIAIQRSACPGRAVPFRPPPPGRGETRHVRRCRPGRGKILAQDQERSINATTLTAVCRLVGW